jgi:cold shock CspA family protein
LQKRLNIYGENNVKIYRLFTHTTDMSTTATVTASTTASRFMGRVKWFNNKAGYGFITVTDGPKSGTDVFVHHSSIKVDGELYKYLVQGEYVEFSLLNSSTTNHEFQSGDVSGIKGGKLMCETRRDLRSARQTYRTTKPDATEALAPVSPAQPPARQRSVATPTAPRPPRARRPPATKRTTA